MDRIITTVVLLLLTYTCLLSQIRWNITDGNVVQTGGFLVLQDAGFYNDGTYRAEDGYVVLSGSGADALSIIGGDSITTFYGLEIHKSANNALLEQKAIVAFNLNLTGGLFDIQNDSLRILPTADISGAGSATYVKTSGGGYLLITSPADGSAVIFPVGNAAFNPLTISNEGTRDTFGVRVRDEILAQNESGVAISEEYVNRTWDLVEELAGGSDLDLTLQWNALEELTNFDRNEAQVVRFENTNWTDQMSTATTGADPYQISLENSSEIGSFSISSAPPCPAFTDCPMYTDPFLVAADACVTSISFTRPTVDPDCSNFILTASVTNSSGDPVVTDVIDPDGDYAPGTYTITWRAFDTDGNEAFCAGETFVVQDNISPTISSCPQDRAVDLNADCELEIPNLLAGITAADNCSAVLTQSPMATTLVQNLNDGDTQNVTITATDPSGNTNSTSCVVTLTANNTATVSVTPAPDANEGDNGTTDFSFTVTRTGPSCAFEVDFATSDGTAMAGLDYNSLNGTLSFTAGEMSKTITIMVNGDNFQEADETFTLVLSNPTNGVEVGAANATTTILNDDITQLSFEQSNYSIIEQDNGTRLLEVGVTFTTVSDPGQTYTVDYATSDGTATTADSDYLAASGTLTFNPGIIRQTFTLTINSDNDIELDETINLSLSNPTGPLSIDQGMAIVTIENDDIATLTVEDVSLIEGSNGTTTDFVFTVSLDAEVPGGFDLAYTTSDGTATTADNDYVDNDGTLTFSGTAGESQQITVLVNQDNMLESDENFLITLGAITNTALAANIDASDGAVGIILNDDAATPTIGVIGADFDMVNVDGGMQVNTFTIVNSGTADLILEANPVSLTGSSAFTFTQPTLLTIPPNGNSSFTITFDPADNQCGTQTAVVSIGSNDADQDPFSFDVMGVGVDNVDPTISCPTVNVLMNSSFEDGVAFNQPGAGTSWSTSGAVFGMDENVITAAQDGQFYLKLFGQNASVSQSSPVSPSDNLTASVFLQNAFFDPMLPGCIGLLQLEYFDASNNFISATESTELDDSTPLNIWTEITLNDVAPAGAARVRLSAVMGCTSGGAVFFDAASLIIENSSGQPAEFVLNNDPDECFATVSGLLPIINDNCTPPAVTYELTGATSRSGNDDASGLFNVGTTTVSYTASDGVNTATCNFEVVVNDTENPTITCPTNVVQQVDAGQTFATVNDIAAIADDNCPGESIAYSIAGATTVASGSGDASGTQFNLGISTVTYDATDAADNTNSCSFTITVNAESDPEVEITDPCACKNNATTLDNGQFDEVIQVFNALADETWTVTAVDGLFQTTSPAPPAAPLPIAVGTQLAEVPTATPGQSNYELAGIHVDGLGYSLTVS
ncbi:MAG: Calx-beta domain-containing protein, partial [Bacteroidota bacterium]